MENRVLLLEEQTSSSPVGPWRDSGFEVEQIAKEPTGWSEPVRVVKMHAEFWRRSRVVEYAPKVQCEADALEMSVAACARLAEWWSEQEAPEAQAIQCVLEGLAERIRALKPAGGT